MTKTKLKKKKPQKKTNSIAFRAGAGARVGFTAAEQDRDFLSNCFVPIDQLAQLLDVADPGSILLGRTGAGKSATLLELENREQNVIRISPTDLALQYVSNSTIIKYFEEIGVDLSLFYQLLWRHVLTEELLNYRYNVQNSTDFSIMMENLKGLCGRDNAKKEAIDYINSWGNKFWSQTNVKVQEIVKTFEDQLTNSAELKIDFSGVNPSITAGDSRKTIEEVKTIIERHGKHVVESIQIRRLAKLMDTMAEDIFNDDQRKYYVVIDNLDDDWVSDELRLKLIRSLLDTLKAFRRVPGVKIIVALRSDLIDRVYKYTRSKGSQRGKDRDWEVNLYWTEAQLMDLASRRLQHLFKRQYTKENVGFYDVFQRRYRTTDDTFDHIIKRTLMRPRDIVVFINEILSQAAGKTEVTARIIDAAEISYSKERFQDLCDEWEFEHPYLSQLMECFRGFPSRLNYSDLSINTFSEICDCSELQDCLESVIVSSINDYLHNDKADDQMVVSNIVKVLYDVGFLSVRLRSNDQTHRIVDSSFTFEPDELGDDTKAFINPIFWGALNIKKEKTKGEIEH